MQGAFPGINIADTLEQMFRRGIFEQKAHCPGFDGGKDGKVESYQSGSGRSAEKVETNGSKGTLYFFAQALFGRVTTKGFL